MATLCSKLSTAIDFIRHPRRIGNFVLYHTASLWPDEPFLIWRFYFKFGYFPNLKEPRSFNEKMNWLKLHYRNPILPKLADKYEVKRIVKSLIGEDYVVPNYGVWHTFDEIDFGKLPDSFVLKTTGDSSGTFLCKDKSKIDMDEARRHVEKGLGRNYYYKLREWGYKDILPRIIADKLLEDHSGEELRDYKFWCFNGVPKVMYCTIKAKDIYENFYDMDFKPLDINHGFRRHQPEFSKPEEFELMKQLAAKLSEDLPFVRIDFFDVDGHVYFGEYTFFDWGGMRPFEDEKWDREIGSWIELPEIRYE